MTWRQSFRYIRPNLSEEFIERHSNTITWGQSWADMRPNLSEEFIERAAVNPFRYVLNELPSAAQEMQNRILMRRRRAAICTSFARSNIAALRIYANQLNLVEY